MFSSSENVKNWRAVDVRVEGAVYRGMACDMIPGSGLVVDFDYPGHRADLVNFDRCVEPSKQGELTVGQTVETLFRRTFDQPWCWYPSKLLAGSSTTYAFVDIGVDGEVRQEVMEPAKVRTASDNAPLWVQNSGSIAGPFYKHETKLAELEEPLLELVARDDFLRLWSEKTRTHGVKADGSCGCVAYMSPSSAFGEEDIKYFLTHMSSKQELKRLSEDKSAEQISKRRQQSSVIVSCAEAPVETMLEIGMFDLSPDMLCEALSFLKLEEQSRLRLVCRALDSFLQTSQNAFSLIIDRVDNRSTFQLATIVHEAVTKSTRTIFLTGTRYDRNVLGDFHRLHTILDMLRAKKIKVTSIVISRVSVDSERLFDDLYREESVTYSSKWASVCGKILLESVEIRYPELYQVALRIRREVLDVKGQITAETLLDKWEPKLDEKAKCTWIVDGRFAVDQQPANTASASQQSANSDSDTD